MRNEDSDVIPEPSHLGEKARQTSAEPSGMVERVMAALIDNIAAGLGEGSSVDYEYAARSAISAMREPTDQMLLARNDGVEEGSSVFQMRKEWRAMIDEALQETPVAAELGPRDALNQTSEPSPREEEA